MNVLKPHLQTTISTLLESNTSHRQIERVTGIDRKTIRTYAKRIEALKTNSSGVATGTPDQTPPPRPPAQAKLTTSICEPHRAFIEAQLRFKRNYMAIYQDLVDSHGFTGAYNSVKRFAGGLCKHEPEQFDRLEFAPGEEAQVDYGEGALTRVAGTDRFRKPRLFVMTLRYSRRSFRRVVWKSSQETWARLHEQAWRYFGGACRYVVLDNLKEGVIKPDLYEPQLNAVYAATLKHYGVVGDPARVRDPNRKGTVEHAIGHTQATALKGRRFQSIEEQNQHLEHWETKWAAQRIHGSERRQVEAMFQEERPHLLPLPLLGMQYFTEGQYTVNDDSCVRVDHSSYAARPAAIGSRVLVRLFARRLEIRDLKTQALLRTHDRAEKPGTVVLPMNERVFNPSRETQRILNQAKAIGAATHKLCETLFEREGRVGQRKLWGIVGLVRRYPRRLIEAACERAMHEGVCSYGHVKTLTEQLMEDALALLDAPNSEANCPLTQSHALIRAGNDYADLFTLGAQQSATLASPQTTTQPETQVEAAL
ncbi:MAG TPA: IS21 family transposase [Rhodoferax sp.]